MNDKESIMYDELVSLVKPYEVGAFLKHGFIDAVLLPELAVFRALSNSLWRIAVCVVSEMWQD